MHWERAESNSPRRSEVSNASFEHHASNFGAERQNAAYQARAVHESLLQESSIRQPYIQQRRAYSTSGAEYSTEQIYGTVHQPNMGRVEHYNQGYPPVVAHSAWNNGAYQTWNNNPYQTWNNNPYQAWNNSYYVNEGVYPGWNNGACYDGGYNDYCYRPAPYLAGPYGRGVVVYGGYPYGRRAGGEYLAGSIINMVAPLALGLADKLGHHNRCY